MNSINLLELIPRCHAGSRAKGFWDVTPNQGQQLMLVVSELAEALEADRKGRKVTCNSAHFAPMLAAMGNPEDGARALFESTVKDTVEDELADAYIRLCDFAGGFGLPPAWVQRQATQAYDFFLGSSPENLGEALLELLPAIVAAKETNLQIKNISTSIGRLQALAEDRDIDLATHIELKLRYNATRPAKHGKAY